MKLCFILSMSFLLTSHLFAQVKGCMQPLADNYNSSATIENGACKFSVCYFPGDSKYSLEKLVAIKAYKHGGLMVSQSCANDSKCNIAELKSNAKYAALNPAGQLSTECCANKLTAEGAKITCNPQNFTNDCWCKGSGGGVSVGGGSQGVNEILGCMEKLADNFNTNAKKDDESCKFSICTDSSYIEFDNVSNKKKVAAYNAYSSKAKTVVNASINTCKIKKSGANGVGSGSNVNPGSGTGRPNVGGQSSVTGN